MGCTAPQTNWPTAIAKLMVTMPSPVLVFSGDTNRPSDWRAPIVIISSDAAATTTSHQCCCLPVPTTAAVICCLPMGAD
jgi:hypothetical protein